jgi:hypothetical protein
MWRMTWAAGARVLLHDRQQFLARWTTSRDSSACRSAAAVRFMPKFSL